MENKQNQPSSGNPISNKASQSTTGSSFSDQNSVSASGAANQPQKDLSQPSATAKTTASQQPTGRTLSSDSSAAPAAESSSSLTDSIHTLRDTVEERFTQGKSDVQSWISETDWRETVNQLPQSVKDLGTKAVDQFNKLTTTQKVVGGALLLGGLGYLASRSTPKSKDSDWSSAKARRNDYRSGNIPRPEASYRSSEWDKRTVTSPSASSKSVDRDQDARRQDRGPIGHVNIDS